MENCIFCEREDLFMENDLAWTVKPLIIGGKCIYLIK